MKKWLSIVYVALSILLCFLPFAGMSVCPTMTTTENTEMVKMPKLKNKKGHWNKDYLSGLGAYFENHFAFRNWLVSADSKIMTKCFKTSPNEKVICGQNGWLFYSSTLNDYLGQDVFSEREAYNVARTILLTQEYVEDSKKDFLFTVAPNKNSLYKENMPYYYSYKVSREKNLDKIVPYLKELGVHYVDLTKTFKNQKETLYLHRDSHWNNKGALLAFQQLMENLPDSKDTFSSLDSKEVYDNIGDLNSMLFPKMAEKEKNYEYNLPHHWKYKEGNDVEDYEIQTSNAKGENNIVMYRDSFGNTLLPFVSDTFKNARYNKAYPYTLEDDFDVVKADCVIDERVERNLYEYLEDVPYFSAIPYDMEIEETVKNEKKCRVWMEDDENDDRYVKIFGTVNPKYLSVKSNILVTVNDGEYTATYDAFGIRENDYLLRLSTEDIETEEDYLTITVSVQDGEKITPLTTKKISLPESFFEEEE